MKTPSLSHLLRTPQKPPAGLDYDEDLKKLDLHLLRIQQGIWHHRGRVIVVFEGFDAAGKGGTIRRFTEKLDPRGVRVHGIAAPAPLDQAKHYLYRFWKMLPEPGTIAIFDRSWYGRVLVERVEGFAEKKRWRQAYDEINNFEKTLRDDGIEIVKIFLGISKKEQFKRYEERLADPFKQWKLGEEDLRNRLHWSKYVAAADEMFAKTSVPGSPWHLIAADHKPSARSEALHLIADRLSGYESWMNSKAAKWDRKSLKKSLKKVR